ncbi:MAG: hypothetical protein ACRD3J_08525, partial [Thermoanaerobaculia bacterium]
MSKRAGDQLISKAGRTRHLVLVVVVVACGAAAGLFEAGGRTPIVAEQRITYRPVQTPEDGYVSSNTCRACHPSQYETWRGSYHRTMTQVATPE